MSHSEVDRARLLDSGDVEIRLQLPISSKGDQLVISAVVIQDAAGGHSTRAIAHTSYLFTPAEDGAPATFTVPRDPESRPFDPALGIEARANASYACWSALDPAAAPEPPEGWVWRIGDWS
jgi:hypothetical protein